MHTTGPHSGGDEAASVSRLTHCHTFFHTPRTTILAGFLLSFLFPTPRIPWFPHRTFLVRTPKISDIIIHHIINLLFIIRHSIFGRSLLHSCQYCSNYKSLQHFQPRRAFPILMISYRPLESQLTHILIVRKSKNQILLFKYSVPLIARLGSSILGTSTSRTP